MKLRTTLLAAALTAGIVPLVIIGAAALWESRHAISTQAFNQLESVREIKKSQLENFFAKCRDDIQILLDMLATARQNASLKLESIQAGKKSQLEWYFQSLRDDLRVLSKNNLVLGALGSFNEAFKQDEKQIRGPAWRSIDEAFGHTLVQHRDKQSYYDLFLISANGDIVYTTEKNIELGQNLFNGPLTDSPLSRIFKKSGLPAGRVSIQDFEAYAPADKRQLIFMAVPLFHYDGDKDSAGVLAVALTADAINRIMRRREGMGHTGESYLAGKANGRTAYRNDRVIKKHGRVGYEKSGADIDKALAGKSGIALKLGSTGEFELGAYAPLEIPGLHWGIFTTMRLMELITPKVKGADFFTKYIQSRGYYDLLLIHPQGKIFYSARDKDKKEDKPNVLENSDLALVELVREVLQNRAFGMSDYSVLNDGPPSMFLAQPLIYDGNVELAAVLRLSDTALDEIMHERAGMGESGEIYLAGSDLRMRSNSLLAPDTHSIKASFAGVDGGKADTQAVHAALLGRTDRKLTRNYRGDAVLSAYTPLTAGGHTWALIAEISQAEAFAAVKSFQGMLGGVALLLGVLVFFFSRRFAQNLLVPLWQVNAHLKSLAGGKPLEDDADYRTADEIAEIIDSSRQLRDNIKNAIRQANAIAAGDYHCEIKLLSEEDELGKALAGMTLALREATARNVRQDWLKSGQNRLNECMRGERDVISFAENVVSFIATWLEMQISLFYVLAQANRQIPRPHLELLASYAFEQRKNTANIFELGESVAGQAALERKMILMTDVPEEYACIQSGTGAMRPVNILVMPIMHEDALKGVIELGSVKRFTETQLEFLKQVTPSIGIAMNSIVQ
ncbi:MAG: GAF domain-containing protein [Gammaproteobacteria bacterium]|nr:GAF domain-containing protein [Gammaproteobacteria bacterium]